MDDIRNSTVESMYETWKLSYQIQNDYGIPPLLKGPPLLLTNMTRHQQQTLNAAVGGVGNAGKMSTNNNNNSNSPPYSFIVQPVYKANGYLLIKSRDFEIKGDGSGRGINEIRKFLVQHRLNATKLFYVELPIQVQLLKEHPLLVHDYQILLFK